MFYQKSPVYHPQFTYGKSYTWTYTSNGLSTNYRKFVLAPAQRRWRSSIWVAASSVLKTLQLSTAPLSSVLSRTAGSGAWRERGVIIVAYSIIYADLLWRSLLLKGLAGGREASLPHHEHWRALCAACSRFCDPEQRGTFPQLPEALRLIWEWGFIYKSIAFVVWLRKKRKADSWFYGLGFWTRTNAEVCQLATRGYLKWQAVNIHQFIISPIEVYSKKAGRNPGQNCGSHGRSAPCGAVRPADSARPGMCGATRYRPRSGILGQFVSREEDEYALCEYPP